MSPHESLKRRSLHELLADLRPACRPSRGVASPWPAPDRGPYLAIGKRPPGGIVNGAGKVSSGWIIMGSTEIVKPAEAGFHQVAVLLQSLTVGIPYLGKAEHPYL